MFKNSLFKAVLLSALFLALIAPANAIHILLPVEATISPNQEIEIGGIAKGETFTIVIGKDSGEGFNWDTVLLSLPTDWDSTYFVADKTISIDITAPRQATESIQIININLSSSEKTRVSESFKIIVTVKSNLLTVAMENLKQEASVGEQVSYKIVASNDSIAKHTIRIASSLPSYWFEPIELTLEPKQKAELEFSMTPKAYGLRQFEFNVASEQNAFEKKFDSEISVAPSIQGKFLASAYAFPVFSPTLFAYYLINSLFAFPFV
ncbi:MAG: hypothetical protein JW772_04955 [Candidatus Diapherotrites archaeon]|nr:hypothetical protein [Candidatus Diapherotrites archaeon]